MDLLKLELRRADIDLTQAAGAQDQPATACRPCTHYYSAPTPKTRPTRVILIKNKADPSDG
ncbi:MAG: hypothetical protein R3C45_18755 [Phycisphaerales bacterium]